MALYATRIERVTTLCPGAWSIEYAGYLARGRIVKRKNCTWYSSPSAANRAGKSFVGRGRKYQYEVIPHRKGR